MKTFNSIFKYFASYVNIVILNYLLLLTLRITELFVSSMPGQTYWAEILFWGLLGDLIIVHSILLIAFILYRLISLINHAVAHYAFAIGSLVSHALGLLVIMYYAKTNEPVTLAQFQCSLPTALAAFFDEASMHWYLIILFVLIAIGVVWYLTEIKKNMVANQMVRKIIGTALILSAILAFELNINTDFFHKTHQRLNKGFYFALTFHRCEEAPEIKEEPVSQAFYSDIWGEQQFLSDDYPLLRMHKKKDCLTPFFSESDSDNLPDIVLLIVEGLGDEFLYPMHDMMFMPFLSKLSQQSLYWNRILATSEKGLNDVPALLGGLPFGKTGFTELGRMPYHFSLLNVMRKNNYHTSFFYGRWIWEDSKETFLDYNHTDFIWDASRFSQDYEKIYVGDDNYHWGYHDKDLMRAFFKEVNGFPVQPRFDVIYTGSTRAPFAINNKEFYEDKFAQLTSGVSDNELKEYLILFEPYFRSLMYGDDALESFFAEYSTKENYNNTIFLIAGSYPVPELVTPHALKRHHVPFMIYSPLLKQSAVFSNPGSQNDLYNTILDLLSLQYSLDIPDFTASLGTSLCKESRENETLFIPFLNEDGIVEDLLFDDWLLAGDKKLYRVDSDFEITLVDDDDKQVEMENYLNAFHKVNALSSEDLMPDSLYFDYLGFEVLLDTVLPKQRVRNEFKNLITKRKVDNDIHYIDVTISQPEVALEEVFIVFELINAEEEVVQWENSGIPADQDDFTFRIRTEKQEMEEDLYIQLYIWNESPLPYDFQQLRTTFYRNK